MPSQPFGAKAGRGLFNFNVILWLNVERVIQQSLVHRLRQSPTDWLLCCLATMLLRDYLSGFRVHLHLDGVGDVLTVRRIDRNIVHDGLADVFRAGGSAVLVALGG